MALGDTYFAWVNANETTWSETYRRFDEDVIEFSLSQSEGEAALLSIDVARPRNISGVAVGFFAPSRKIWAWFAFDAGSGLVKFFGRVTGLPTNFSKEVVTMEFIAEPADFVARKLALAESLKSLPTWDPIFYDAARADDPDLVLEGMTKIWHVNRETHATTVTDELIGEDGLEEFFAADILFDPFQPSIVGAPKTTCNVAATFNWTQAGQGSVDLTEQLVDSWPDGEPRSFTFGVENWPKSGASLGEGWTVAVATAFSRHGDYDVLHRRTELNQVVKWWDGETTQVNSSGDEDYLNQIPPQSIFLPEIVTAYNLEIKLDEEGSIASYQESISRTKGWILPTYLDATISATYEASRGAKELVSVSLVADVQPLLTAPSAPIELTFESANLTEPIGEGTDAEIPIGDPRRRSYICTPRGEQSLQHLIAVARAHLLKASRAIEISFAPIDPGRMVGITLRKNARVHDTRIPGGVCDGKIIGYSIALRNGVLDCGVTIGCAIGHGGSVTATEGTPIYVDDDYIGPEQDYQEYEGRTVLFDSSVGYTPPHFGPNDDGADFLAGLRGADIIEVPLAVEWSFQEQLAVLATTPWPGDIGNSNSLGRLPGHTDNIGTEALAARQQMARDVLATMPTSVTFRLKSMRGNFESPYVIETTQLKVPTMINLAAA